MHNERDYYCTIEFKKDKDYDGRRSFLISFHKLVSTAGLNLAIDYPYLRYSGGKHFGNNIILQGGEKELKNALDHFNKCNDLMNCVHTIYEIRKIPERSKIGTWRRDNKTDRPKERGKCKSRPEAPFISVPISKGGSMTITPKFELITDVRSENGNTYGLKHVWIF